MLCLFTKTYQEQSFCAGRHFTRLDLTGLSGTNCYCDDEAALEIGRRLCRFPLASVHFLDSGNYHYMTDLWLRRVECPFRLLVFDNHTDMQPPAFGDILSCGSWLYHTLRNNPCLKEVYLVGPDEESYAQTDQKLRDKVAFLSRERLKVRQEEAQEWVSGIPADLPLYISIDKDILCPEEACTGWSQGDMTLDRLCRLLDRLVESIKRHKGSLLGVDICGEAPIDTPDVHGVNDRANSRLLALFTPCFQEKENEK